MVSYRTKSTDFMTLSLCLVQFCSKDGFYPDHGCTCWANSYTKKSYVNGVGDIASGCPPGQQNDAGLCYPFCNSNYFGVGPVCWGNPPNGWVQCGMGGARDSSVCAKVITDQIVSVGVMVYKIVTLGTGPPVQSAATQAEAFKQLMDSVAQPGKLQQVVTAGMNVWSKTEEARKLSKAGKAVSFAANQVYTPEDMVRLSAMVASFIDPSGVSGVVAAYAYTTCSKLQALG